MVNLGILLRQRAAVDRDRPAAIEGERRLTFGELDEAASRVAGALHELGVRPGERVAALLRNGIDYCALYYGAARLGAILCCLNWRLAPPELRFQLQDSGARLLVHAAEFSAVAQEAVRGLGIPLAGTLQGSPYEHEVPGDSPLLLCYTSGTTGQPKGAVLTHANLFWVSDSVTATLDYRRGDVSLIAAPMFHVGGLSFATMFVHRGATAVFLPAWMPEEALRLVARHRVNHFFAVPAMLAGLLEHSRARPADLASLRWLLTGAAPTPERLFSGFAEAGVELIDSYGCTETAGAALCAGRPFLHAQVRLEGAPDAGEILVRGPHVFAGYWNQPRASAEALREGWLHTGDLGRRDAEGRIAVVDRKKDLIISGGENVYPAEVEAVLEHHPAIAELAVIGLPDEKWGEAVCAVAVLRPGASLTLEALREWCRGRLAGYKLPARLVVREAPLPRTATGKPQKGPLRAQLQAGLG